VRAASAPSAVIFDMDGVLIDSGACHRAAWQALLEELGAPVPAEFWRRTIGRPAHEAVLGLLDRAVPDAEARRLSRRKHEHYTRFAARGLPAVRGAAAFVAGLRARRIPRAVATSARRVDVDRLLGPLGLLEHFDAVVTAEDVTRGKPDPEVYLRAAERLGAAPADCVVFEDSLVGVMAARSAGMRVIGLATAHTVEELLGAGAERAIVDFEGCPWPP
jgi:HAD superfamily hydrolase (TIGR01509 family)